MITREGDNRIGHGPVVDHRISDHDSFIVELNSVKPKPIRKVITYRKLKGINMDSFRDSLVESELCSDFKGTAGEYVELYDLVLSGLLYPGYQTLPKKKLRVWYSATKISSWWRSY